jgi:hypothetical protein
LTLRSWNLHATLESSDQAALGYMLQYNYGVQWIFAHDYGPVLPAIEVAWCRLLSCFGRPIDERALRLPIVLMSLVQVGVSFGLMRRLRFSRRAAWAGCAAVAILPSLISDAHYLWAYQTTWLLTGSIALWASLAWFDERQGWQSAGAGAALCLHCLSSLYSYGLPIALLVLWGWHARSEGRSIRVSFLISYLLACLASLAVILGAWLWTGQGQLGRLLLKSASGAAGLHFEQVLQLPRIWCSQLGPVFGAVCAGAVVLGLSRCRAADRRALPTIWACASIIPFTLLADWDRIGYAAHYTFEATFAAALLGAAWIAEALTADAHWKAVALPLGLVSAFQLTLASVDVARPDVDYQSVTGIEVAWGEVRPDAGTKAAGYYVRRFVPEDVTVLSLHTRNGMELPVAEYYCGRKILAHYDVPEGGLVDLWRSMASRVDVVLVETAHARLLSGSDLRCVCILRRGGRVVRMVFARPELELPRRDSETSVMNAEYDRDCVPRKVPMPLSAPPDFLDDLRYYQDTVNGLRSARRLASASR